MDNLLLAFLGGITMLLVLILWFKINAFISLLIASIVIGFFAGMPPERILENITKGMGSTLGFVAIVVGLGSIFGSILEHSGATTILSDSMIKKFGLQNSGLALSFSGFLIAIPVFFDVAFIILVPVLYALQIKTGKSLLYFALPLLSSLAIAHAFIPPTPGPIAVADIIHANLGWVIFYGVIIGLPTTIICGIFFGKFIAEKIFVTAPHDKIELRTENIKAKPSVSLILWLIVLPLVLILLNTVATSLYDKEDTIPECIQFLTFLGHPYSALLISTFLAMYFLGIKYGATASELQEISIKALGPAGIIILITGAGGVFKQMLIETGAGVMLAKSISSYHLSPIILSFIIALVIRILQGSATVAMITAAGMVAPIISLLPISDQQLALIVLSIAAGATGFSHVNDSGFWLVNRYLGLTESQTLRTWTVMTGMISFVSIIFIWLLSQTIS
ncbi:MAG: gluconate transporter [Saprospiraceae bacterium]|nr:gluconate transporter [Saprospiraceae bacterium]